MEFSAIELSFLPFAVAFKFFGSRPAKIKLHDLKLHEMCRTLGVLLAEYDTKDF